MPEDKKKEIKSFFTHKNYYKSVAIVSFKIDLLINYQLLNGVIA